MKLNYAGYQKGGTDGILAIQIAVHEDVSGSAICFAEDGPGGTFLPESCKDTVKCTIGTQSATIDYIMFYEPAIEGADDPRLPA